MRFPRFKSEVIGKHELKFEKLLYMQGQFFLNLDQKMLKYASELMAKILKIVSMNLRRDLVSHQDSPLFKCKIYDADYFYYPFNSN